MTLAVRPAHAELLGSIRQAPNSPRVVVIGAAAVMHHLGSYRETGDVDLAIVAEELEIKAIIEAAQWERDKRRKHRWRHGPTQSVVDVRPAAPRIIAAGRLQFEGDDMELSMIGFDLALANTVSVSFEKTAATPSRSLPCPRSWC